MVMGDMVLFEDEVNPSHECGTGQGSGSNRTA